MARVTITIEGELSELQDLLSRLGERGVVSERVVEAREEAPPLPKEKAEREWTITQVRRFWQLLSPNARRVLKVVAQHPEGVARTDIRQALGMQAREIGGTLASVGHRLRRFQGLPRPLEKITLPQGPGYRMLPSVAQAIATLEP
ncbi:MAG: hypothetical protein ACK4K2_02275 [Dehalococcoidia bacterium]